MNAQGPDLSQIPNFLPGKWLRQFVDRRQCPFRLLHERELVSFVSTTARKTLLGPLRKEAGKGGTGGLETLDRPLRTITTLD